MLPNKNSLFSPTSAYPHHAGMLTHGFSSSISSRHHRPLVTLTYSVLTPSWPAWIIAATALRLCIDATSNCAPQSRLAPSIRQLSPNASTATATDNWRLAVRFILLQHPTVRSNFLGVPPLPMHIIGVFLLSLIFSTSHRTDLSITFLEVRVHPSIRLLQRLANISTVRIWPPFSIWHHQNRTATYSDFSSFLSHSVSWLRIKRNLSRKSTMCLPPRYLLGQCYFCLVSTTVANKSTPPWFMFHSITLKNPVHCKRLD